MCNQCNYAELLAGAGVRTTPNRLRVLGLIGAAGRPVSADEIHRAALTREPLDRVTVYRSLELFLRVGLIERLKAGGQAWRYHLVDLPHHPRHPHFYCTRCGQLACLGPETLTLDLKGLQRSFPALIQHLEIRLEGVCPACLAQGAAEGLDGRALPG